MAATPSTLAGAERAALCDTFERLGPHAPTLCEGWRASDLAAHLVVRERRPDLAVGMFVPPLAERLRSGMNGYAAQPWAELVQQVRSGPPRWSATRVPAVDELVNLVEMVVHHEDVLRGDGQVGPRREVSARLGDAVWTALGRTARLMYRRVKVGVELMDPARGTITARPTPESAVRVVVTGTPIELLLYSYGRRAAADVSLDGPETAVAILQRASLGLA